MRIGLRNASFWLPRVLGYRVLADRHFAIPTVRAMASQAEVSYEEKAGLGIASLDRVKALNALNIDMVISLRQQYLAWARDPAVKCILIRSNSEKAFCAGGDVKTVVQSPAEDGVRFFRCEYALNGLIGALPKPHIAFMDGIVMGGGAGLSIHGKFRVATERTLFAMPECAIGLFPDVGASYFLPRLPGQLGAFLALTGTRLKGADVVAAGLATHLVPSQKLPQLLEKLTSLQDKLGQESEIERAITSLQERVELSQAGPLAHTQAINACFAHDSVEEIYHALEQRGDKWSTDTLKLLKGGSPLSQKLTLREVREGASMSLPDCLRAQFRLAAHVTRRESDFRRGVTALLIDKSGPAQWQPPSLQEVTEELVESYFEPLPEGEELQLDDVSQLDVSWSPPSKL